jgi:hypothetical protein
MQTKQVFYAAVGAPVVAARKAGGRVKELRAKLNEEASSFTKKAETQVAVWAEEGERVVTRIGDAKVVDDLAAKVDFDQVQEQVSKLRDQLEDLISTWRASFRPEKAETAKSPANGEGAVKATAQPAPKTAAAVKKAPAKKAAAKKAPAKKAAPKAATQTKAS